MAEDLNIRLARVLVDRIDAAAERWLVEHGFAEHRGGAVVSALVTANAREVWRGFAGGPARR